jgi:hypothetical protein
LRVPGKYGNRLHNHWAVNLTAERAIGLFYRQIFRFG